MVRANGLRFRAMVDGPAEVSLALTTAAGK
jgi:hypothetical protein